MQKLKKPTESNLLLSTMIFLLLIISCVIGIWIRGINNLERFYVLNIGLDLVGMVVVYVIFCSCLFDQEKKISDILIFIALLFSAFAGVYFDLAAWLVDGVPQIRVFNVLVNTFYYLCQPTQAFLFWQYLKQFLNIHSDHMDRWDKWIQWGFYVSLAMRVINLFTGIYFTVDSGGYYHRARFYPVSMIYVYLALLLALIALHGQRKNLRPYHLGIMASYVIVPLAAMILTMNVYGLSVGPAVIVCEILLMYCVLNVEQGREMALKEQDLQMAARIQNNMLPSQFPAFPDRPEFDIYAAMLPAREVGGDFYDFFLIDNDHLAMVIADVSGKGISASLFMMSSMILIHNTAEVEGADVSPASVLTKVNAALCSNNVEEMFVTVWLGIMTISTGRIRAANAGHEYPMIRTEGGAFSVMKDRHGLVIGAMEDIIYREYEFTLKEGDTLFVYTDGVTEATNISNQLFGMDRILDALNASPDAPPQKLLENVKKSVDGFVEDAPQFDDLTMLCMRWYGTQGQ